MASAVFYIHSALLTVPSQWFQAINQALSYLFEPEKRDDISLTPSLKSLEYFQSVSENNSLSAWSALSRVG